MYLNGLMLISSVLDIGSVDFTEGNDLPYALYLPTYTAAAHYHGVIDGDLRARVAEAEEFAARDLPWALARGNRLVGAERTAVVARYAELTGLSVDYVDRAEPAGRPVRVHRRAAAVPRERTIGRLDMRFTAWLDDPNADRDGGRPALRRDCSARTPRPSTPTSAASWATAATWPTTS